MVAASQPLAAQAGLDILEAGGNAVDAAVAVNAMLGLVEPHMNGMGGDMFAIVWHADSEQLYALNATGRSGYAFNREVIEGAGDLPRCQRFFGDRDHLTQLAGHGGSSAPLGRLGSHLPARRRGTAPRRGVS